MLTFLGMKSLTLSRNQGGKKNEFIYLIYAHFHFSTVYESLLQFALICGHISFLFFAYTAVSSEREFILKRKLSICLTCGHKVWVEAERMGFGVLGVKVDFLHWISGLSFRLD